MPNPDFIPETSSMAHLVLALFQREGLSRGPCISVSLAWLQQYQGIDKDRDLCMCQDKLLCHICWAPTHFIIGINVSVRSINPWQVCEGTMGKHRRGRNMKGHCQGQQEFCWCFGWQKVRRALQLFWAVSFLWHPLILSYRCVF